MDEGGRRTEATLKKHIRDLLDPNHRDRATSVDEVTKRGAVAAPLLVEALLKHPSAAWAHENLTTALEEIGKPAVDALLDALRGVRDFRRSETIYLVETIAQTLGRLDDRRAAGPLAACLHALNVELRKPETPADRAELLRAARSGVHLVLSRFGATDGVDDLLKILGDGRRRIHEEIVEALARVGDRRALPPLLRLYARELNVTEWSARNVKWAFREIARRERVDRDHRMFRGLSAAEDDLLDRLLARPRPAAAAVLHLPARATSRGGARARRTAGAR